MNNNSFGVLVMVALAAVTVWVSVGWNQPVEVPAATPDKPQPAPVSAPLVPEEKAMVEVGEKVDRLLALEIERTKVLRELAVRETESKKAIAELVARVEAIENPLEPVEPPKAEPVQTSYAYCHTCGRYQTWTYSDGRWRCPAEGKPTVRRPTTGPLGGQVLPRLRGGLRRLGWRILHPFGGRFCGR